MKKQLVLVFVCVLTANIYVAAQYKHEHKSFLSGQIDCTKDRGKQAEEIAAIYLTEQAVIERLSKLSGDTPSKISQYVADIMPLVKNGKSKYFKEFISGQLSLNDIESLIHEKSLVLLSKYLDLKAGKNIYKPLQPTPVVETNSSIKGFISGERQLNGPCLNPDMETCNFTDWDLTVGHVDGNPYGYINVQNTNCFAVWPANNNCPGNSGYDQHHIVTGGNDQFGFPMVNPDGGSCSAMLGDYTGMNYGAAAMRKTFLVAPGNAVLTLSYAAVLQDGGHSAGDQPFFRVRVYDQNNNSLSCGLVDVYANDGQPGWNTSGGVQWRPWTNLFIPLASYLGQNITIEFTVGDCNQGGHYGYAYVEASCNPMALLSGSSACSGTVNLVAPPGAASYQWNTGATTQTINVTQSGYYSVQVIPVTGPACAVTLDTNIVINPNPPTPNFNHNAQVCYSSPISFQNTSIPAPGDPINQYSWNFGDGSPLNTQQNPQHTYSNPAGGNYNVTLTITTQGGCIESITYPVTQPPQITTPTNSVIEACPGACNGQAIVAPQGGVQPYSYAWTTGGNPVGGNNPALTNLCAGNYSVTVTDNMGCTQNANVNVGSGIPPNVTNISTTNTSCPGSCDGSITITAGPNVNQYSINNGATFQANNIFNNVCAGNYNIVVQDANGCQATGNAQINAVNTLTINPGPNQTICIGQNTNISVNGNGGTAPLTFIWDNGLPNGTSHNVNPTTSTVYTVYVQDANGCITPPVQITVNVHPPLNVIALQNQSICPGQQANITAQASGGNGGPYTYGWTDGVNNINGPNQSVSPTSTTVYTVTATDNCTTPAATAQVTITVNQVPNVTFIADNLQGCSPVNGQFTNTTDPNLTGTCLWDFGNGITSNNCNPSYTYTQPGCYTVTLTVTSPQGCIGSLTQNQYICVWPNPIADFIPSPQPTNILTPHIQFTNASQGATIYSWDFAGLGNSNAINPSFTFPDNDPGTYMVCLQVENQYGCIDDICKPIVIDDYFTIYVPNAFTPTGDGINDIFLPILDGIYPETYQFMIFNRWGELIFETNNPQKGWDGTYRGVNSQQDVYVWKIIVKDAIEHKKRTFYGHVNLLR